VQGQGGAKPSPSQTTGWAFAPYKPLITMATNLALQNFTWEVTRPDFLSMMVQS
jgi:hypothetical protein